MNITSVVFQLLLAGAIAIPMVLIGMALFNLAGSIWLAARKVRMTSVDIQKAMQDRFPKADRTTIQQFVKKLSDEAARKSEFTGKEAELIDKKRDCCIGDSDGKVEEDRPKE